MREGDEKEEEEENTYYHKDSKSNRRQKWPSASSRERRRRRRTFNVSRVLVLHNPPCQLVVGERLERKQEDGARRAGCAQTVQNRHRVSERFAGGGRRRHHHRGPVQRGLHLGPADVALHVIAFHLSLARGFDMPWITWREKSTSPYTLDDMAGNICRVLYVG